MRMTLSLVVLIFARAMTTLAAAAPVHGKSLCVDALEQMQVLRTPVPVYVEDGRFHRSITQDERRMDLLRYEQIASASCSRDPKIRVREKLAAHRLYVARSPECSFMWARYAAIMTPKFDFSDEQKERLWSLIEKKCPAVRRDHHWLIENVGTVHDPQIIRYLPRLPQ